MRRDAQSAWALGVESGFWEPLLPDMLSRTSANDKTYRPGHKLLFFLLLFEWTPVSCPDSCYPPVSGIIPPPP